MTTPGQLRDEASATLADLAAETTPPSAFPRPSASSTAADVSELLLARIARESRDGIAVVRSRRIEWANEVLGEIFGRTPAALVGQRLAEVRAEVIDPGDGAGFDDLGDLCVDGLSPVIVNLALPDGRTRPVAVDAVRVDGPTGDRWAMTFRSVGRQLRADDELRASEEQFRALAANAPIGVFHSEHGVRIGYLNRRFAELWGRDPESLRGTGWLDAIHDDDRAGVLAELSRALTGEEVVGTFRVIGHTGETRLVQARVAPVVRSDRSIGFVGSIEDVTEARRHEQQLEWQATHDPLTGLANRTSLLERVDSSWIWATRSSGCCSSTSTISSWSTTPSATASATPSCERWPNA